MSARPANRPEGPPAGRPDARPAARPDARPGARPEGPPAPAPLPPLLLQPEPGGPATDLRRTGRLGLVATLLMVLLVAGWAQGTRIGGAVIAPGEAVVRGKPQIVQSFDAGIVSEIRVREGEEVAAGTVLLRLDPALIEIELELQRGRLAEERARVLRLEAELSGRAAFAPADLDRRHLGDTDPGPAIAGQREIFEARQAVLAGRHEQLAAEAEQAGHRIAGLRGMLEARREQLALTGRESATMASLAAQGLAREAQLTELRRAEARLRGEIAETEAEIARLEGTIRGTALERNQSLRQFREQAAGELREALLRAAELGVQIVALEKKLARVDIIAPAAGIVHEMQVSTLGGVVPAGETLMQIVPSDSGIDFELRVEPRAIDQIFPGQEVRLAFSGLDRNTTPEIAARVLAVPPGTVTDPLTRQSFYRVPVAVAPEELARLGGVVLIPGMPVEAFLQTGERTVLSYLLRPLADQLARAFRDG